MLPLRYAGPNPITANRMIMNPVIRQTSGWIKNRRGAVIAAISFFLVLLFTYTAISKFLEPDLFYSTLRNIPLLGSSTSASIAARAIPIAELVVAFLIGYSSTRKAGFVGALILLLLFQTYVLYIVFFSPYIPCSCGGITEFLTWTQQLYFNLGTILLVFTALKICPKKKK